MDANTYAIPNLNYFISIDIFKRYFEKKISDLFKCLNVLVSHTMESNVVLIFIVDVSKSYFLYTHPFIFPLRSQMRRRSTTINEILLFCSLNSVLFLSLSLFVGVITHFCHRVTLILMTPGSVILHIST